MGEQGARRAKQGTMERGRRPTPDQRNVDAWTKVCDTRNFVIMFLLILRNRPDGL
jgi:hypothetical protein